MRMRLVRLVVVAAAVLPATVGPATVSRAVEPGPPRTVEAVAPAVAQSGETAGIVATVRDAFGAAVAGATVVFTETGAGRLRDGDIVIATTGPSGEAVATALADASETGVQTVRATIGGETGECGRPAGDPAGAAAGVCAAVVQISWRSGSSAIGMWALPAAGVWGTRFSLTGLLTSGGAPLAARVVRVERRLAGEEAFREIGLATTAEDGLFTVEDRPEENAVFRVAFAGEPDRDGAVSAEVRIAVRHGVRLNVAATPQGAGSIAVLSGAVLPAVPGGRVSLQRFSPASGWRTIGTAALDRASRYSFRVLKRSPGLLLFRVAMPSSGVRSWNVSGNRAIRWP